MIDTLQVTYQDGREIVYEVKPPDWILFERRFPVPITAILIDAQMVYANAHLRGGTEEEPLTAEELERHLETFRLAMSKVRYEYVAFLAFAAATRMGDAEGDFDGWMLGIEEITSIRKEPSLPLDHSISPPELQPSQ